MLVLCRSMWVNKACHFFLVPLRSSSTPLYPSIVLRAGERAPTPCPSVVFNLGLTFESYKELGVRHFLSFFWRLWMLTRIHFFFLEDTPMWNDYRHLLKPRTTLNRIMMLRGVDYKDSCVWNPTLFLLSFFYLLETFHIVVDPVDNLEKIRLVVGIWVHQWPYCCWSCNIVPKSLGDQVNYATSWWFQ